MARQLTTEQRTLLRSGNIKARLFTTWWMDDATYRYCDDTFDMEFGGDTWVGANALASASDIRSGAGGFAAESVTLILDGTRLFNSGFSDPAAFFQMIMALPLANRRVDLELALGWPDQQEVLFLAPLYSGKINHTRLVDPGMAFGDPSADQTQSSLEIVLDSLAARYRWVNGRMRTHEDQLNIDPEDHFFSYVSDNIRAESTLYWGKKTPEGALAIQSAVSTAAYNLFH